MFTVYNLYSVNWGIFSTSRDVQYMGGYHEYIGACSVHQRISLGYHAYIGGVQYIREISLAHWGGGGGGGGGYHEYTGWCSAHQMDIMMHLGEQLDKSFQLLLKTPMYSWYPTMYSWYPMMYWTSLNVLMVSPTCIMISPNVLNIPQCTEHPPMYSWYPLPDALMVPSDVFNTPNILMRFPQCTEHPPMYWTTHYTGWFYVCIKSTNGNILVFFLFNCEFMHF